MTEKDGSKRESFVSRWARRKVEAREADASRGRAEPGDSGSTSPAGAPGRDVSTAGAQAPGENSRASLPPIESLTPESDFSDFARPEVDASLRNRAMKVLFSDARFNAMDGLDIYVGDYTQPDPIPEEMLRRLNQARSLFLFDDDEKAADAGRPQKESNPSDSVVPGADRSAIPGAAAVPDEPVLSPEKDGTK